MVECNAHGEGSGAGCAYIIPLVPARVLNWYGAPIDGLAESRHYFLQTTSENKLLVGNSLLLSSEPTVARRWLAVDSPLEVELVATPRSQDDQRIARLCYLVYDQRVRLWIDAHTARPFHGSCRECPKALEARVEQIARRGPDVLYPIATRDGLDPVR